MALDAGSGEGEQDASWFRLRGAVGRRVDQPAGARPAAADHLEYAGTAAGRTSGRRGDRAQRAAAWAIRGHAAAAARRVAVRRRLASGTLALGARALGVAQRALRPSPASRRPVDRGPL